MIAMQYSLVLPADYDMGIIERRIAERGYSTDGFAGLAFKAYLHAKKQGMPSASDNLYAPFYLWHTTEGMNAFLCGPGFVGLTQSFGWPKVATWSVWHAEMGAGVAAAHFATRQLISIAAHADLAALRAAEIERARKAMAAGAVATVAGFDPGGWNAVRFQLWEALPDDIESAETQVYSVGHISTGK